MHNSRADKRARAGTPDRVTRCFLPALLFLVLSLITGNSFGQNRSSYDINDPRNPDCPCHQYQKQADKEYEQQQRGNKQITLNVNLPDLNPENDDNSNAGFDQGSQRTSRDHVVSSDHVNSGAGSKGVHSKKKKPGTTIRKRITRARLKNSKIKWQRPDYSVCYKW